MEIVRQSLDARKKPELFYSYSVNVIGEKRSKKYTRMPVRRLGKANVAANGEKEISFPGMAAHSRKSIQR